MLQELGVPQPDLQVYPGPAMSRAIVFDAVSASFDLLTLKHTIFSLHPGHGVLLTFSNGWPMKA